MEQLLCVELMAIQGRFDAFLPFQTAIESWLQRRYMNDVLEAHFGIPFIQPDKEAVDVYTDKSLFGAWLVNKGLGAFTPTIYVSKWEVVYPCLVKFTHGRLISRCCLIH